MKGFRGQEGATEGVREGKFGSHRAGLLTISFPLFEDRMSFAVWKTLPLSLSPFVSSQFSRDKSLPEEESRREGGCPDGFSGLSSSKMYPAGKVSSNL